MKLDEIGEQAVSKLIVGGVLLALLLILAARAAPFWSNL